MMLKTKRTEIDVLTREELLDLKLELTEESILIKNALDKAMRRYEREGILADAIWYDQNKERRLLLTIDLLRVDQRLRKVRKTKLEEDASPYRRFYEEAAATLPAELFSKIVEGVKA